MKVFKISHLVKSEDLNHHGTLFAGRTAEWLVEAGFVTAAAEHGRPQDVLCVNVHGFTFKRPVEKGDILTIYGTDRQDGNDESDDPRQSHVRDRRWSERRGIYHICLRRAGHQEETSAQHRAG